MEFIEDMAIDDNETLSEASLEFDNEKEEIDNLTDNTPQPDENDVNFYREINNRFLNQSKNPQNAIFEQDDRLCEIGDSQPKLYDPVSRSLVVFDRFEDSKKQVDRFKKTLKNFGDNEISYLNL